MSHPLPNKPFNSNRMSNPSFEDQSSFPERQRFNHPTNLRFQSTSHMVPRTDFDSMNFEQIRMQQLASAIPHDRRGGIDKMQATGMSRQDYRGGGSDNMQATNVAELPRMSQQLNQNALPRNPHKFMQPPVSDANLNKQQNMNLQTSDSMYDQHRFSNQRPVQQQLQDGALLPGHAPQGSFPNPLSSMPPGNFNPQVTPPEHESTPQAMTHNIQSTDGSTLSHPWQNMPPPGLPPSTSVQSLNPRFTSVPPGHFDNQVSNINTNFPPPSKDFTGQHNFRLNAPPRVPFQDPNQITRNQPKPKLEVASFHVPPPQIPLQSTPMPFLEHGQNSWQNSFADTNIKSQPHLGYLNNENKFPIATEPARFSEMVSSKVGAKPDDVALLRENDQEWLDHFLHKKKKICLKEPKQTFSIHVTSSLLMDALHLTTKLAELQQRMASSLHSPDLDAWRNQKQEAHVLQARLQETEKGLQTAESQPEFIKKIVKQRNKRFVSNPVLKMVGKHSTEQIYNRDLTSATTMTVYQERIARLRKEKFEAKAQAATKRAQLHEEIDAWQCKILHKEEKHKQDKELKVLADSVLGDVRKKKTDLTQTECVIKSLEKLRQVRKEAAERKGLFTSIESDRSFESTIAELTSLLVSRKAVYDAEEETLQVMLDTEQEETKEKERERAEQKLEAAKRKEAQRHQDMIFGNVAQPDPSDVRYSYWQYYDQANFNFNAFIQISVLSLLKFNDTGMDDSSPITNTTADIASVQ